MFNKNNNIIKMGYITRNAVIFNINTDTTITNEEIDIIIIDASAGDVTLTLPAIPNEGLFFYIKDTGNAGTNSITIEGNGKNIDAGTSFVINTNYDYTEIFYCSLNDKWFIL